MNQKLKEKAFFSILNQHGLPNPTPEHKFHDARRWRFDYAFVEKKIAVEVEGGVYGMGKKCTLCKQSQRKGHLTIKKFLSDIEKYNNAVINGWRVLRCTPQDFLRQSFIDFVIKAYLE